MRISVSSGDTNGPAGVRLSLPTWRAREPSLGTLQPRKPIPWLISLTFAVGGTLPRPLAMISSEFGPEIDVTHDPNATLPIRFLKIFIAVEFSSGRNGRMASVRFDPGTFCQLVIWQLKTLRKVLKRLLEPRWLR